MTISVAFITEDVKVPLEKKRFLRVLIVCSELKYSLLHICFILLSLSYYLRFFSNIVSFEVSKLVLEEETEHTQG